MTEIRQDRSMMRQKHRDLLMFGLPFVIWFGAFWTRVLPEQLFLWTFPIMFLLIGTGFYRQQWRRYHLKCPNCGVQLDREDAEPGGPVVFQCVDCNIVWNTGFFDSDDG